MATPSADAFPRAAAPQCSGAEFPVVGIGASAGGLTAFEASFSAMPAGIEPGMAFVLVQHLAADQASILGGMIGRCAR